MLKLDYFIFKKISLIYLHILADGVTYQITGSKLIDVFHSSG